MFAAVNQFLIGLHVRTVLARTEAEESGQTMVEYGLILALISIAAIVVMGTLSSQIGVVFGNVTGALGGGSG